MAEFNKDPFTPSGVDPLTGVPYQSPDSGGAVLNLNTSVSGPGLKIKPKGPVLDMGGNPVSKNAVSAINTQINSNKFNLYELQSANQLDPFTGRPFNNTDSFKMYDGVNRGHLTGTKEIEFLHGKGEKDPTARELMVAGLTPTTENDWEDMRAQRQGVGTKALYGAGNMLVTAGTTGVETLIGAPTGLASLGIAGLNAETQRAAESFISGENKTKTMLDAEQSTPGMLSGVMDFLDIFGAEPHKIVKGSDGREYYLDESAMTEGQFQEGEQGNYLVEKTSNEDTLERNLRSAIESDAALIRALREKNLTVDDAVMAIKEEKAQRSGAYQAGLGLKTAFGGTIGYNAPGGIGSRNALNRYKEAVSKTIQDKSGPEAWQDIAAAYWDTDLGNYLDELRESASNAMPFYYTRKELDSDEINWVPFTEGSANFYFDKVMNGIGFAAGAMAPLYLTRGKSVSGSVYRSAKNLVKRTIGKGVKPGAISEALGAEAAAATRTVAGGGNAASVNAVENLATGQISPFKGRMMKAGKMLAASYAASYSEAAVESRDVKKQYIEARLQEWEAANPGKSRLLIQPDEMAEIERYANAAGNTNFAINMPILLGSNMFMISALMGSKLLSRFNVPVAGIGEETVQAARIAGKAGAAAEATWFTSKAGKVAEKFIRKGATLGKGAIFEGGQELAQYASQQFNLGYWHKRQTDGIASVAEHFADAFEKTFTEKEGLEQGLIGAMIGGGMTAISSRGSNKSQKQATEKILAIRNSGILSKIVQRAEMSSETQAMMEDYHKATKKGDHKTAANILAKALANEAMIAEQFGGTDMYEEMLNDMENMSPEEFVKFALPHLTESQAKAFTEQHVKETVKDVKDALKRNTQLAKNIKEMVPIQERSTPLERMTMSQEQRDQEDLQIRVTEAYRNMLYSAAIEMDNHDAKIEGLVDKVNEKLKAQGLPSLDPNILKFSIKSGRVTPGDNGKVDPKSIEELLQYSMGKNTVDHLNLVLRALDPQDREEINNAFTEMFATAAAREQAVSAYEELRKNPDKRYLYYEALQADQSENLKERRNQVAKDLILHAQTAEQLINALPNITDEDLKAEALKTIKKLKKRQAEIRKDKFSNLSVAEMRKLDYDSMSPIVQAAYNESLKYKKNSELRAGITNKVNAILDEVEDEVESDLAALFKAINREKQGDKILAKVTEQLQIKLGAKFQEAVQVTGLSVYYNKAAKKLMVIAQYQMQADPSETYIWAEAFENLAGLDQFENRFKELLANDASARKTAEATTTTPEDEVDDLGQRILEEERTTADPTVVEANKLVTNADTEVVEIDGIRRHAPTGRGFLIGGRRYENTGITIMDAVNFSPNGEVSSITLFDVEKQEYYTFRKRRGQDEVEAIDAIYEKLLLAMASRNHTSQAATMTEEETQEVEQDRQQTIQETIDSVTSQEYALPVDSLTNDVIEKQMLELASNIRILNKVLDSVYADYAALGYTLQDANKDETVKKLRGLIASMQKMHNARRTTLVDRGQEVKLKVGILGQKIEELQVEVEILDEDIEKLQKVINDNQELLNSGKIDPNTVEGAKKLAQLQNEIEQARQVIAFNEKKAQKKINQINDYNYEIDILMGRRTVSAEGTEEVAAGQITEEQSQRTGEISEDTGLDELGTEPGEVEQRLADEQKAANEMSNNTHTDQAGGQVTTGNPTTSTEFETEEEETPTGNTVSVQLDIQLTKGEYDVDNNYKVLGTATDTEISVNVPTDTRKDSRIVVNDKGDEIGIIKLDKKALGNPNTAKPGTTVVFEVREDTKWWQEEGKDSLPEDRHWEQVPIFVKIVEDKVNSVGETVQVETYVGMLTGFRQDSSDGYKGYTRQIIYDTIKNGGKATSTIKSKKVSTGNRGNIINLRNTKGDVIFVNPASENGLGTRFVNGVPVSTTPIVAIATGVETKDSEGNTSSITRRWEIGNAQGLAPEELSKISYALEQAILNYDTLTDAGVVAFLVQDPNGNYRVVQGSTRFLTQEAQDAAIASLKNRDVNTFNQIVGTNKIKAATPGYMYVEEVSKNWGAEEGKNGIRVTFWSPAANSLVSVQYDKLITAIEQYKKTGSADLSFSFTVVEQTEEGGKDFKSASRDKAEFEKLKPLMTKEFLDQLAQKRFQVSKALLETNQPYVSPVNPDRSYNSYTDYLFSEKEAQEQRKEGIGSKAILASDVANNGYGSVFFDIGLEFGTIESNGVPLPVKEEMKAKAFDQPTTAPIAAPSITADINLGLPTLPGMPGAPTTTPAATPTTTATVAPQTTSTEPAGPTVEELEKERDELIQPLEQEKSELEKILEGNQNTPTVEEIVENEITEEEMTELQEELGGTVEEVKEQVVAEVVNQMNDKNPAPPTSLLQKVARRIKRILLNLMIGTVLFNSMSFTYSGNAKAATYETVNVENLQSFESAYIDQEATNRLDNLNIITSSFEGSDETYLIVDKANALAHLFQGDSLINTFEVGTGRKAGDAQTKTVISNGKVLWEQGNQQTGAGIYTVGSIGQYKSSPSYTLKNEEGIEVPTVLHETLENRKKLFGDNNVGNNRMSFGCVNFKAESIKRLAAYKNFKTNSKVFILPDDAANKFQIVDGELRFISQDANVNRTVKGYTAQPISIKTEKESAIINSFTTSISENKAQLMALYPSISNANYNQIASIAYGILGQESSFGTFGGPRGQYGKLKDDVQVLLGKGVPSVGVTQVRYTSVNKKVRDAFGIKDSKDIKDNPKMAAVATMAVLLDIYENEIPSNLKQDFRSLLPLGYSNRTEFAKAIAGDSTTYENQYVRNVNTFADGLKVYQGLAESETKQEESKSSQQAPVSFTLIGLAAAVRRRQDSGETLTDADELVIRNRIAQIDTEIANIKKLYADRIKNAGKARPSQEAVPASVAAAFEAMQAKQKKEKAAKEAKAKEETVEQEVWKKHIVKKGETLKSLAGKYGTTVEAIKKANNLKSNFIREGMALKLKMKVKKKVAKETTTPTSPTAVPQGAPMSLADLEALVASTEGSNPEDLNEDIVSLQTVSVDGIEYEKSEVTYSFLIELGKTPQEANEILKEIC